MNSMVPVVFSLVCALVALGCAWSARSSARELERGERRVRSLEVEVLGYRVDLDKLTQTIRRMEGRQTQALAKNARPNDEPDSKTDPNAWRLWKNRQITPGRPFQ